MLAELRDQPPRPRVLRHFERTVAALLAADALRLAGEVLPLLLAATRELEVGVEAAQALVRRELARSPDDGPLAAPQLLARHLLGDDAGAREQVRRIGRRLRGLGSDAADDLALAVVTGVFGGSDLTRDPAALAPIVAPLSEFLLHAGPERPRRAAQRAGATSDPAQVRGYAAWARTYIDRLGHDPFWCGVFVLADRFDDRRDADELDIPF